MFIEPGESRSAHLLDKASTSISMFCQICSHRYTVLTETVNPSQMPSPVRQPLVALNNGFDRPDRNAMTVRDLLP